MDQVSELNTMNPDEALLEVRDSDEDAPHRSIDTDRRPHLIEQIVKGKFNVDLDDESDKARFLAEYEQWFMGGEHDTLIHMALKAISDNNTLFDRFKPLFALIVGKYPDILKKKNSIGDTTLHYAIQRELSDAAEYLCRCVPQNAAAEAISCRGLEGTNCLHAAIKYRLKTSAIKYFASACEASAVLEFDYSHPTPLHYAVDDARYTDREIDDGSWPLELVRLLVAKNDAALLRLDASGRTPYQLRVYQRESKILKAVSVSEASTEEQTESDGTESTQTLDDWDLMGGSEGSVQEQIGNDMTVPADPPDHWELVDEDPVTRFILSYCMMKFSQDKIFKSLYHPGQERQIELDLSGLQQKTISEDYLDRLFRHMRFESMLKCVTLPPLTNEASAKLPEPMIRPDSSGTTDPVVVFKWLRKNGVKRIIKVVVVDNEKPAYTDSSIKEVLGGFDIRIWNWRRLDLSCEVIYSAAPLAEEIYLYWTGNNEALLRWTSLEGLPKFTELETVNVSVHKGRKDFGRLTMYLDVFSSALATLTNDRVKVRYTILDEVALAAENMGKYIQPKHMPWVDCITQFGALLRRTPAFRETQPIKIGVLVDGIDASLPLFEGKIASGKSFYPDTGGSMGSCFISTTGHGTHMCTIIATLSPNVKLYIAKLGSRIANSKVALEAIDWAMDCDVNVIFIGCDIIYDQRNFLSSSMYRAQAQRIAIFSATNDDSVKGGERPAGDYDGSIRIRAASEDESMFKNQLFNGVNFLMPGRKALPIRDETGSVFLTEVGNSIATAVAAGLAGFLLSCSRFVGDDEDSYRLDNDGISDVFLMMEGGKYDRFPRVVSFERLFLDELNNSVDKGQTSAESGYRITEIEWDDTCTEALKRVMRTLRKTERRRYNA